MRFLAMRNASDERLAEAIGANLWALEAVIRYCGANGIRLFRIGSDVIPFGSSPANRLDLSLIHILMSPMTTGTLNWIVAIAVPNRSMATAISAQFPYFLLVLIRHLLLWYFACTSPGRNLATPSA